MDEAPRVELNTTAHYFLEGLNEIGIDYLFCNFGTDHAPLIEEMARWNKTGKAYPRIILCPHENVAMHMAGAYALATGRGQGVMVHVDAGTANAAMAAHNLYRARLPVLLMAGRSPFAIHGELPGGRDNYVHFVQDPYDQASLVRPYVKWEYTLRTGATAKETLRRAHSVMHSDPRGPVYLMLPRETLAESWDANSVRSFPQERYGAVAAGGTDPETVRLLAERMLAANAPLLITAYAGRNPAAADLMDELARFAGIRVVEFNPTHVNIAHDSPCYAGQAPGRYLTETDLGLLVDVDVPWLPKYTPDNSETFWAHIDVDTVKQAFPMWGFPNNIRIAGDSCRILGQLLRELRERATPKFRDAAARRVEALAQEHAARVQAEAALAAEHGAPGSINPHYLCAEVGRVIGAEDIVVNEGIRNAAAVTCQLPRTRPGTTTGLAGGGLGFSGGMALGFKLAHPERNVVQFVGDGGFYFGCPAAVYAVSRQYGLPIFTVVMDNSGWAAVKEATLRMYPEGEAKKNKDYQSLLAPQMNFAKIIEAAGGYGEQVSVPAEVPTAIERCLKALRDGRSALLHARVTSL